MIKSTNSPCRIFSLTSSHVWFKTQLLLTQVSLSWPSSRGGCAPPLHMGGHFAYGHQSSLHYLQKVYSFESLTVNIPVSHKVIWTNSEYCIIWNGNHMLQSCTQTCAFFICSASLII